MKTTLDKKLKEHDALIHSEALTVVSHIQREQDDWVINTIMINDVNVPFKYKRKKMYKSLVKSQVNISYYCATESIAGFEIDVMNVVRIKRC